MDLELDKLTSQLDLHVESSKLSLAQPLIYEY